ncbi:MAG: response regulator [Gemmatimonadaceae bacterium]
MKFLVIDDSPTMLRIVANTLERIGYTDIVKANDGAEALAKFDASIGFIITAWNMPKMNGLEFTIALRATPGGEFVPLLMVTARSASEDIARAVEAGVSNYILKPFTAPVLKEKIDAMPLSAVPA